MRALAILVAVATSGCAIGAGTSTVGIWRPHRQIDTEVCIEDPPGRCSRTVQVARDLPARSFGGGVVAWFNPGYVNVANGVASPHRFALDSHYEYLRGRGPFALGLRIGGNLGIGLNSLLFTTPVTLVGHFGYPRWSVYGGAGYTPYAVDKVTVNDVTMSTRMRGFNAMAGGRVMLRNGRGNQLTSNIDVIQQYLEGTVVTSVTTAIGVHF